MPSVDNFIIFYNEDNKLIFRYHSSYIPIIDIFGKHGKSQERNSLLYIYQGTPEYHNLMAYMNGETTLDDISERWLVCNSYDKVVWSDKKCIDTYLDNNLGIKRRRLYKDYKFANPLYSIVDISSNKFIFNPSWDLNKLIKKINDYKDPEISKYLSIVQISTYSLLLKRRTLQQICGTWPAQISQATKILFNHNHKNLRADPLNKFTSEKESQRRMRDGSGTVMNARKAIDVIKCEGNLVSIHNCQDIWFKRHYLKR